MQLSALRFVSDNYIVLYDSLFTLAEIPIVRVNTLRKWF